MGATVNSAVYQSPSEASKQLYKPKVGEEIRITGEGTKEHEYWYRVQVNGITGYAYKHFFKKPISDFPYPLHTLLENDEYMFYLYHLDTEESKARISGLRDEASDILSQKAFEMMRKGEITPSLISTANTVDPNHILSEYSGVYVFSIHLLPAFVKHEEHEFGEYTYNSDATTEADGTKTAVCYYCGRTDTKVAEGTRITGTAPTPEPPVMTLYFSEENNFYEVTAPVNHLTRERIRFGEVHEDGNKAWTWTESGGASSYTVLQTYLNTTYGEKGKYWLPVNDNPFMEISSELVYHIWAPTSGKVFYCELPFVLYPDGDAPPREY